MRLKFLLPIILLWTIMGGILPLKIEAASPSSILVDVTPENPAPNESVTVKLNSYSVNLDSVLINWSVNGKTSASGIGRKSFSLNAPAAGSATNVIATLELPEGAISVKAIIRSAVMELLWQATDSYVPPFYRGKALPTPDSEVKIVAMPEIKIGSGWANPKNMIYTWKKDYTNAQQDSGYGRNSFTYINDYLDDANNVSVIASTIDQKYSSSASIDINTYQPKIIFYKNDNVLGTLWEQALVDGHKIPGEEVIEAIPYFISPKTIGVPILTWKWFINNSMVGTSGLRKNLLPVRAQPGVSGTSVIKLEIENIYKLFASASREIDVEF